ncbi:tyrosine phosphatase IA-2 isoform X2 [Oratosquilla oratoria]|uniref:tyrosine phosphatase IA-2 isoform X2 n=1 Tax=Oratosquilla oratoria TaxID=337810 RepID=UPI003F75FDB5
MERLFKLGYRWSHAYTQCVLQSLLDSIRHEFLDRANFEVAACNSELDQDLEGALRAIESEELEQVDPRDLAIVRFMPSATDPHSNYADEIYFPQQNPGDPPPPPSGNPHGKEAPHLDQLKEESNDISSSLLGSPTAHGGAARLLAGKAPQHDQTKPDDGLQDDPYIYQLPQQDEGQHWQDQDPWGLHGPWQDQGEDHGQGQGQYYPNPAHYPPARDAYHTVPSDMHQDYYDNDLDYGAYPSPYEYQHNPVYKKRSYPFPGANNFNRDVYSGRRNQGDLEDHVGVDLESYDSEDAKGDADRERFRKMAELFFLLSGIGALDEEVKAALQLDGSPQNLPGAAAAAAASSNDYNSFLFPGDQRDRDSDEDDGVFQEEPARPMYTEAGLQIVPDLEDDRDTGGISENDILSSIPLRSSGVGLPFNEPKNHLPINDFNSNFPGALYSPPSGEGLQENYEPYDPNAESANDILSQLGYLSGGMEDTLDPLEESRGSPPAPAGGIPFRNDVVQDEVLPLERILLEEQMAKNGLPIGDPAQPLDLPENNPRPSLMDLASDYAYGNYYDEYPAVNYPDYQDYEDALEVMGKKPFSKFVKKDEQSSTGVADEEGGGASSEKAEDEKDAEALAAAAAEGIKAILAGEPDKDWSFKRPERLDVKKPGPNFRSSNDFAFDRDEEDNELGDGNALVDYSDTGRILPTRLYKAQPHFNNFIAAETDTNLREVAGVDDNRVPDLLLADEGFVEDISNDVVSKVSQPNTVKNKVKAPSVHKKEVNGKVKSSVALAQSAMPRAPAVVPSYAYININGRFPTLKTGSDTAKMIAHFAGLKEEDIVDLSITDDRLTFEVKDNAKGITAADVAKSAEDNREAIKKHLGVDVSQVGVGSKTQMSAVVFSTREGEILTAAAIVCGVMAALLVAATVLYFLRRHARSKAKLQGLTAHDTESSKDYEDLCRARMQTKTAPAPMGTTGSLPATEAAKSEAPVHVPSQRISSLSKESDAGTNSPSSRSSTSSCEEPVASNMDISTGHMVLSYMEDHLRNKDRLEQEWIALCAYEAEPCATTVALKTDNSKKNRYPDAVPYDHNRVLLNSHANVNESNYINASSITDHDPRNPAYIATQGPLPSTTPDFWQLVWEQGSVVLVMLTRLTENGHSLCHRYWPEEGSELYHIYEVHLVSEHIWCDDYLVRSFYLKNIKTGETRTVTQFHFLSWPDSGVPASTKALLEFRRKVNKSYRGRSCPIIVNCSDGIGRTGTYCLIDMVLNRMAKGAKEIDIAATLEHIRDQRPSMVKTKAQFEFVLMAVAEEVHAILKALPQ